MDKLVLTPHDEENEHKQFIEDLAKDNSRSGKFAGPKHGLSLLSVEMGISEKKLKVYVCFVDLMRIEELEE